MIAKSWYAHGKLLITGEYLVLEGAKALAIPLKLGQYLSVKKQKENTLIWNAMKPDRSWFQAIFQLSGLDQILSTDEDLSGKLKSILLHVKKLNPDFLSIEEGYSVETVLEFDPEYGFGSSSTLVANLARWAEVDPFELQKLTFGGSGYDVACATINDPIIYQLINEKPTTERVGFDFNFTDQIYFVYLGKKQRSTESIQTFKTKSTFKPQDIKAVNTITKELLFCKTLNEFEGLLKQHELLLSKILKRKTVQSLLFADHNGVAKSLGGWGGDFVLMTSHADQHSFEAYLTRKGFDTYYRFDELVL